MKQKTLTEQKIDRLVSFIKAQNRAKNVSGFMNRPYIPSKPKSSTDQLDFKIL